MSDPAAPKTATLSDKAKGKMVVKSELEPPKVPSKGVGRMTSDRKFIVIQEEPLLKVATDAEIFTKGWERYKKNPDSKAQYAQAWKQETRKTWMPEYEKEYDATKALKRVRKQPLKPEQRVFGNAGHPPEVPKDEDAYLYRMVREPLIRRDDASPNLNVKPDVPYSDEDKARIRQKFQQNPEWFVDWVRKDKAYENFGIPENDVMLPFFLRGADAMQTDASLEDALRCCSVGMNAAGSSEEPQLPVVTAEPAPQTKEEYVAEVTQIVGEITDTYSILNGSRGRAKINLRTHLATNSEFSKWLRRYSHFETYTEVQLLYARTQSMLDTFSNYMKGTLQKEFEESRVKMWNVYGKNRVAKYIHARTSQISLNEEDVPLFAQTLSTFYDKTRTAMQGRAYELVTEEDWNAPKAAYRAATGQDLTTVDLEGIVTEMVAAGGLPYDICNADPPVYLDNEGTRIHGYYLHTEKQNDPRLNVRTGDLQIGQAKVETPLPPERAQIHWKLVKHLYAVYDATTSPGRILPEGAEQAKTLDHTLFTKQRNDCELPDNWLLYLHDTAKYMHSQFPEEFFRHGEVEGADMHVDISKWLGHLGAHLGNAKHYKHLHEAIIFFGAKPSYWEFLFRGGLPGKDHFVETGSAFQPQPKRQKNLKSDPNARKLTQEEKLAAFCSSDDFFRLYFEDPPFYSAKDWDSYLEEAEAQPQPDYTNFVVLEKLGFAKPVLELHPTNWHFHKVDLGDEHSVTYFARCAKGNTEHYLLRVLYDQDVHYCMYFAILSKQDYMPATESDGVGSEFVRNAHDEGLKKVAMLRVTELFEGDEASNSEIKKIDLNELAEEAEKKGIEAFLKEFLGSEDEDEKDVGIEREVDRAIQKQLHT